MQYKIELRGDSTWVVYEGRLVYGEYTIDKTVFSSNNIADCYAWIKAKEENLIID